MSRSAGLRTGKVFAFNFLTGTELTLEEADSWENGEDLTLADYAGQYIESYLGSWFGINNSGYQASVNLDELKQRKTWKS